MTTNNYKNSLLIPSQLPEFVRDDPAYANFVLFLQAYYEWLETTDNVADRTKSLLSYKDIDETTSEFIDYFQNDFLSYFPKDILADKQKVFKLAKKLYQSKGTPSSYKFLFRVLYDTDVDFFYTKDAVLRASAGKWYIAKSLKVSPTDIPNISYFTGINNLRVFGETSKSIATIENTAISGERVEIFISDIERLFQSGEFIRIVDSNNQSVLGADSNPIRAKIVGQISQININPKYRGLYYKPGDPVIVYGGLNSPTGQGAYAKVGTTTSGSIQQVNVINGGYGYTLSPNTVINTTNSGGAILSIGGLNPDPQKSANASLIPINYISLKKDITIGNTQYNFIGNMSANANTSLANAFTFLTYQTNPISSVLVNNGGGGITTQPQIVAESTYSSEDGLVKADLSNLGILAPIQIVNGGVGYRANDVIVFTGGDGYGSYANVATVDINGAITSVKYVYKSIEGLPHHYPLGGMGYKSSLPSLTVVSANTQATNAVLAVPGILGTGATFSSTVDTVGSIKTIAITSYGEDYVATPNVSLTVQDILVTGLSPTNLPLKGDTVYQGTSLLEAPYFATVNSSSIVVSSGDPLLSVYSLRVFNYNTQPNLTQQLKINNKDIVFTISTQSSNVTNYGDGTAKATASFLNGLVISQGQYLDTAGQPSGFDVLQSEKYNNYTYEITLEKEIAKYRDTLLSLLHPAGMQVIGRYALKAEKLFNFVNLGTDFLTGHTLDYFTNSTSTTATITSNFVNQSNNIVVFNNLNDTNIADYIFANSTLSMVANNGFQADSLVLSVDGAANTATLKDNVWLTFANVAYVTANAGGNVINITSLTNSYDIINNGNYSDSSYPLKDIVYAGDTILVNNMTQIVASVDYVSNLINLEGNLTYGANGLMSVNRTFVAKDVQIFNFIQN